ncbi:unnamed protein product [Adineta steineri]|uniref:Cap-specific mRNA (nucleoside-2'-O-)-methyltransferase n=1 Tax=Adineta steineri TaxID=433720 RepID=A0A819K326_9BILA|nr:unnamed protein product [Adineta steineri]
MSLTQLNRELLKLSLLDKNDQDSFINQLDDLFRKFGIYNIEKWRNLSNKNNTLLHEFVEKDLPFAIRHVINKYTFDINVRRDTDGRTLFQLALDQKNKKMHNFLKELAADKISQIDVSKRQNDEDRKKSTNIVWVDLEMTSIDDPEILECAVIITDKDLNELAQGNWVIHFDQSVLTTLGQWHQDTFADRDKKGNGLFADVLKSKLTKEEVEEKLLTLIQQYCPAQKCPLAGSSIHIDKHVLQLQMPKVHSYLHYRIIDVSSFQGIMRRWAPWMENKIKDQLAKKGQDDVNHRAMDDIKWSISFMREFRPILEKQQPRDVNRQPIQHRRQRSVSPSLVARNKHENNNKVQLYADERRLLERLELEKTINIKSLHLNNENQEIYIANPHLREVFINKQQIRYHTKEFTVEDRFLKLSSKHYDNKNLNVKQVNTTEYWGQRKLLLTEIEFLTNYTAAGTKYLVVYAGAAPGSHINYLSSLFPYLDFELIDSQDFSVTETNEIKIRSEMFTDKIARSFSVLKQRILFICNVRTFDPKDHGNNDMQKQMAWHRILKPYASLLYFRLPKTQGKTEYFKGNLIIEPWSSRQSTECRLVVDQDQTLIDYDHSEFENALIHFHNDQRIRFYRHNMDKVDNEGLDHCYDCRTEIFILQEYIKKFRRMRNESEVQGEIARMSREISRKIVDEKRKPVLDTVRTLDVIPRSPPIVSSSICCF